MSKHFYVRRGSKIQGPVPANKLKQLASRGELKLTDDLAESKEGPWHSVASVGDLARLLPDVSSAAQSTEKEATPARTISCEDCGGTMSKRAAACPHCGAPAAISVAIPIAVPGAEPTRVKGSGTPSVTQLDVMKFLVENMDEHEVFLRVKDGASIDHTLIGAFDRSGVIRGTGKSGISFSIAVKSVDDGVSVNVEGETPDGPTNFGTLFDPASAEGWGLLGATSVFNAIVNGSAAQKIEADVQVLSFNILNALDATEILGLSNEAHEKLSGGKADLKRYNPGNGRIRFTRLSKYNGCMTNLSVLIDGENVGTLTNGSQLIVSLLPGKKQVMLKGLMVKISDTITVAAGHNTQIECYFGLGARKGGLQMDML